MRLTIPASFDVDYYRSSNPDLSKFGATEAAQHYKKHGEAEGRAPSPYALRENFIPMVARHRSILEIGPFTNPAVRGPNVKYFDVLNRAALIERAKIHSYPTEDVPEIDFVSPTADLSVINEAFDAVFSSHAIEHQPDLIRHIQQVERILNSGGAYYLIIPDKRYCFDHFLPESCLSEVLAAYYEERRVHTLRSVIEHRAIHGHNDANRHWRGDHGELTNIVERTTAAVAEWRAAAGSYIDVHAWQFTPASFQLMVDRLRELGFSSFRIARIYPTPVYRFEFCVMLVKV